MVRASDFDSRLPALFQNARPHEELAFHSRIRIGPRTIRHLLLIDFAKELGETGVEKLRKILGERYTDYMALYDSGRSAHGYVIRLVTRDEWIHFMGMLLLLNLPHERPLTDARWIGHRLIAGYSALRWSRNTPQYLSLPTRSTFPKVGQQLQEGPH